MQVTQDKLRNVAIIAHVDHGKTTLVDAILKQSKLFRDNQKEMQEQLILDSGDLEREKGITITAKNISIPYKGYKINIIDTPGHADFGGEVERTLTMADGCILLIDAQEGTMPQTRFVLKRALELNLVPILIINKIDKSLADPARALDEAQDLFLSLATREEQLDFPTLYAVGRAGKVFTTLPDGNLQSAGELPGDITPLLDVIIDKVPAPKGNSSEPFQMRVTSVTYDPHLGRYLIGRVQRGTISQGQNIVLLQQNKDESITKNTGRVTKLLTREGLEFVPCENAVTGDIVAISGIDISAIGGTICAPEKEELLEPIIISDPSVRIVIEANTSPFAGKEGKFVTMKQIQNRLELEKETNVGLQIEKLDESRCSVAGRGELQLSILIETLRREGFEFQIRKPEVVLKDINGVTSEPVEDLHIEVPDEYAGEITQALAKRKGQLLQMHSERGQTKFQFKILTRNLLGLRIQLLTATKGNVMFHNYLEGYVPYTTQPDPFRRGVLISTERGAVAGYSLNTIQERGDLFIGPATEVYEGMIIGICKFPEDIEVNALKNKHASNVRISAAVDSSIRLKQTVDLTLEFALAFIAKDEMIEITPQSIRLRKVNLTKTSRDIAHRKERQMEEDAHRKNK